MWHVVCVGVWVCVCGVYVCSCQTMWRRLLLSSRVLLQCDIVVVADAVTNVVISTQTLSAWLSVCLSVCLFSLSIAVSAYETTNKTNKTHTHCQYKPGGLTTAACVSLLNKKKYERMLTFVFSIIKKSATTNDASFNVIVATLQQASTTMTWQQLQMWLTVSCRVRPSGCLSVGCESLNCPLTSG